MRVLLAASLALGASGCSGCAELEGQSIAAGSYVGLAAFDAGGGDIVLNAIADWNGEEGELVVVRLDGATCHAGAASAYAPFGEWLTSFHGHALWRRTGPDDVGAVSLVDFACNRLLGPIEGVRLPVFLAPLNAGGSWASAQLLRSGDQALWIVDPVGGRVVPLAGPGSSFTGAGPEAAWVLEGGTLFLRGYDGATLREVATGVSEMFWVQPPLDAAVDDLVYVDADGLHLLDGADDLEPELLATDVCEVHPVFAGAASVLGYLSPCSEQRLVLHDLESGVVTAIASGVAAFDWNTDPLFFVTGPQQDDLVGDLHLVFAGGEPVFLAEDAALWTLQEHGFDDPPYALVITHHGASGGRLLRVGYDGSVEHWHDGVVEVDDFLDWIAALGDFDGSTGNLYLRAEAGGDPELLASGVPPESFALGYQLDAIGYIADAQSGAGRLVIRELGGDRSQVVDEGVTEFEEVLSNDRPGLAYIVGSGERAGIWYAEP
jgi:hypothetical protein